MRTGHRPRRIYMLGLLLCCGMATLLSMTAGASACSIDGVASMTINGYLASQTKGVPTTATLAHWAQFSLGATAPGQQVQLGEEVPKLRSSLPAEAFKQPFEWSFGDGATARGVQVAHTYANPGWYKVVVQYYWGSHRHWVQFDNAQLQVRTPTLLKAGSTLSTRTLLTGGIAAVVSLGCLAVITRQLAVWRRTQHVIDETALDELPADQDER